MIFPTCPSSSISELLQLPLFQTKLTIDANTSGISTAFTSTPANSDVTLYSSARIGARSTGGAGSIFAIQVQTTGDA